MAGLRIENLRKSFGAVDVLKGIDLDIRDGEFVSFLGPSGCGKSTLLRSIAGLEELTDGAIHLDGREITDLPSAKRDIAMVFQNYALYPHMNVRKNMSFGLSLNGMKADEIERRVSEAADILRITYSWDMARACRGRLAIERPEHDKVVSLDLPDAVPLALEDIRVMATDPRRRHVDEDVLFFAVSDRVEPIGPTPSLTAEVPLLSNGAYTFAGRLRQGDLVETLETGLVPVLQVVNRTVPACGSFRPVRLRAPYFGLLRDIVVAPDQRLVVGGSEVEYIFGREAVLVPARHLVNGISAIELTGAVTVTYSQVILPRHESVIAAGCPVESLYVGRIRRKPGPLAASLLAPFDRRLLPEHARSAYLVVKPFEAITLMQRRAA